MNIKKWLIFLAICAAISCSLVVFILFPSHVQTDFNVLLSTIIFSFTIASLIYLPLGVLASPAEESRISAIGILSFFSLSIVGLGFLGLIFALSNFSSFAYATNIFTIFVFILMLGASGITSTVIIKANKNQSPMGTHLKWGDMFINISRNCSDNGLKLEILRIADESRFLSRNSGLLQQDLNDQISIEISNLNSSILENNYDVARHKIVIIRNLIEDRENLLKNHRSKV